MQPDGDPSGRHHASGGGWRRDDAAPRHSRADDDDTAYVGEILPPVGRDQGGRHGYAGGAHRDNGTAGWPTTGGWRDAGAGAAAATSWTGHPTAAGDRWSPAGAAGWQSGDNGSASGGWGLSGSPGQWGQAPSESGDGWRAGSSQDGGRTSAYANGWRVPPAPADSRPESRSADQWQSAGTGATWTDTGGVAAGRASGAAGDGWTGSSDTAAGGGWRASAPGGGGWQSSAAAGGWTPPAAAGSSWQSTTATGNGWQNAATGRDGWQSTTATGNGWQNAATGRDGWQSTGTAGSGGRAADAVGNAWSSGGGGAATPYPAPGDGWRRDRSPAGDTYAAPTRHQTSDAGTPGSAAGGQWSAAGASTWGGGARPDDGRDDRWGAGAPDGATWRGGQTRHGWGGESGQPSYADGGWRGPAPRPAEPDRRDVSYGGHALSRPPAADGDAPWRSGGDTAGGRRSGSPDTGQVAPAPYQGAGWGAGTRPAADSPRGAGAGWRPEPGSPRDPAGGWQGGPEPRNSGGGWQGNPDPRNSGGGRQAGPDPRDPGSGWRSGVDRRDTGPVRRAADASHDDHGGWQAGADRAAEAGWRTDARGVPDDAAGWRTETSGGWRTDRSGSWRADASDGRADATGGWRSDPTAQWQAPDGGPGTAPRRGGTWRQRTGAHDVIAPDDGAPEDRPAHRGPRGGATRDYPEEDAYPPSDREPRHTPPDGGYRPRRALPEDTDARPVIPAQDPPGRRAGPDAGGRRRSYYDDDTADAGRRPDPEFRDGGRDTEFRDGGGDTAPFRPVRARRDDDYPPPRRRVAADTDRWATDDTGEQSSGRAARGTGGRRDVELRGRTADDPGVRAADPRDGTADPRDRAVARRDRAADPRERTADPRRRAAADPRDRAAGADPRDRAADEMRGRAPRRRGAGGPGDERRESRERLAPEPRGRTRGEPREQGGPGTGVGEARRSPGRDLVPVPRRTGAAGDRSRPADDDRDAAESRDERPTGRRYRQATRDSGGPRPAAGARRAPAAAGYREGTDGRGDIPPYRPGEDDADGAGGRRGPRRTGPGEPPPRRTATTPPPRRAATGEPGPRRGRSVARAARDDRGAAARSYQADDDDPDGAAGTVRRRPVATDADGGRPTRYRDAGGDLPPARRRPARPPVSDETSARMLDRPLTEDPGGRALRARPAAYREAATSTAVRGGGSYRGRGADDVSEGPVPNRMRRPDEADSARGRGAYSQAMAYTALWFAVPLVALVLWSLTLNGEASATCVDGLPCASQRGAALASLTAELPKAAAILILSLGVSLVLRKLSDTWKPTTVGFASAVVGGGLATVAVSVVTGQPLG